MSHAAQITTGFHSPEKRPKNPQSRRWLWRLVRHFFHDAIVSEPRGEASTRDSRRASKAASKTHRDNGAPILRHACRRSDARKNNTTDAPDHRCHSSSRPLGACMFQAEASRGSSLPNVQGEPRPLGAVGSAAWLASLCMSRTAFTAFHRASSIGKSPASSLE